MSKNLSLDTRTVYQSGLIAVTLASIAVIILVIINSLKLVNQPKTEPAIKIREQQLQNAINLVDSSEAID